MYIALGIPFELLQNIFSATKLHLDVTDAANIMLWAGSLPDGSDGFALWYIYPPEVLDSLRKFLRDEGHYSGPDDPVHSQSINITPSMFKKMQDMGINAYVIRQYMHQAVIIPAGCAHTVSSESLCQIIFISLTNLIRYLTLQIPSR